MTNPFFEDLSFEEVPIVPNHRIDLEDDPHPSRPGVFGRRTKSNATPRPPKARKPPPPNKPGQFIEPLTQFYTMLAMGIMPFKPQAAMVMMSQPKPDVNENTVIDNCAKAWDDLAQKNESVRTALATFTTVGVWGALFAAHAPILGVLMADTPIAARFDPAAGMAEMLRKKAEAEQD